MLSAPSIIVGLFVYVAIIVNRPETIVQKVCTTLLGSECFMGHFSGWAGSIALAIIVIPVVVRTTENMLLLVPNGLREAGASIGAPRSSVIRAVTWRAARSGIITGVLLAVARISGETAPLLFTAFNNSFWSHDMNGPMASLPYVIFTFAMSSDAGWQQAGLGRSPSRHRRRADSQHHGAHSRTQAELGHGRVRQGQGEGRYPRSFLLLRKYQVSEKRHSVR
ncbi:MAG: ABC transporter permease subunit [Rhizomicrobium sp.]